MWLFPKEISTIHNYLQHLDAADERILDTNNITSITSIFSMAVAENVKGVPFSVLIRMPSFMYSS